jgi:dipeptidase
MLFAKNSDREPGEAQVLELRPAATYETSAEVACTYLNIPQVKNTQAVLLSRPFWMWGAEMGANEAGVVIGNEAVHSLVAAEEKEALLGMDLVRLGLERSECAEEAVRIITGLLERFGQGGNCGLNERSYYHNSFLIADPKDAFVLETVGREWVIERVMRSRAISNTYTIGAEASCVSNGLHALFGFPEQPGQPLSYNEVMADRSLDASGRRRCARATLLLESREGLLDVADLFGILRDHGVVELRDGPVMPKHRTICMHVPPDEFRGQTVGSLVSSVLPTGAVHWVTGCAAPCTAIFKPLFLDVPLPPEAGQNMEQTDRQRLWWRHEQLRTLLDKNTRVAPAFMEERDALETGFREQVAEALQHGGRDDRARVVNDCWRSAAALEERWLSRIVAMA